MKHKVLRMAGGIGVAALLLAGTSSAAMACDDSGRGNSRQTYQQASYHSQSDYKSYNNDYSDYNRNNNNRGAWYQGRWYNNDNDWVSAHRGWSQFQDDNGNWMSTSNWSDNDWDNWYQSYCQRHNY